MRNKEVYLNCGVVGCNHEGVAIFDGEPRCTAHMVKTTDVKPIESIVVVLERYEIPRGERCQVAGCSRRATHRCVQSGMRYCDDCKKPHGYENNRHTFDKIK